MFILKMARKGLTNFDCLSVYLGQSEIGGLNAIAWPKSDVSGVFEVDMVPFNRR